MMGHRRMSHLGRMGRVFHHGCGLWPGSGRVGGRAGSRMIAPTGDPHHRVGLPEPGGRVRCFPAARRVPRGATSVLSDIGRGRVVVVDSLSTMVNELDAGKVDIYIDSPFPVGFVTQHSDIRVLLRRFKRGAEVYRSVLFARADGGIESLADLRGRMLAFGEPFSTTGYLLPKAALVSDGFKLVNFADPAATVPDEEIGILVFSNDAENTMVWVLKGKVTAGAVNEDYFQALAGDRISELRILDRSEPVPRNIVRARRTRSRSGTGGRRYPPRHGRGRRSGEVLDAFEETSRFESLPTGGIRRSPGSSSCCRTSRRTSAG